MGHLVHTCQWSNLQNPVFPSDWSRALGSLLFFNIWTLSPAYFVIHVWQRFCVPFVPQFFIFGTIIESTKLILGVEVGCIWNLHAAQITQFFFESPVRLTKYRWGSVCGTPDTKVEGHLICFFQNSGLAIIWVIRSSDLSLCLVKWPSYIFFPAGLLTDGTYPQWPNAQPPR
jgi:hypothetical protein